ncbi:uncharacterized protein LOC133804313 isoform X2 [Humulus lupulus]|uniref:uncharacterized protein LOC133804313 isoform X2 n=1 Tax=Humulus lupulus TaxID=3486 RepID=UPI002B4051A6|nr:uncharacterized protein LOC133804313 isoform X2 [Humulus lupulus]
MESRKERLVNQSKKIVESVNAMSLINLDEQQVHSLMMIREIARGIIHNRVERVTRDDLKNTLSSSIEKMVGSCKDVNSILSKIPCEGMDRDQTQSVSQMKAIVSTIVTKRAKLATTRHSEPVESVRNGVDVETVESEVVLKDIDAEGIEKCLLENDTHEQPTAEGSSSSEASFGAWMSSRVDFEALGIPNPPSWSIHMVGDAGVIKDVQIPRAPAGIVVEGLPLSSYLPEPHKTAFEYLLELIAALKHMVSTGGTENGA